MSIKYSQLTLAENFSECQDLLTSDTSTFFSLLEEHINLCDFIPVEFYCAFHLSIGRKRDYPLKGFLSALILQKILTIPTDALLINLLSLCRELRDFCGFTKVPDAPMFTRFKQTFIPQLELMFSKMVDYTEPICQAIDSTLASIITLDTSGIELYVKENNPKYLNTLIRQLKTYYKNNLNVDPYKMAYGLMPSQATSSPDAKQMYINGHFCYADKFAIITNGLGLVRNIAFLDDDFKQKHQDIEIDKKSDSPDEDKSIGDSSALKPVLQDFFELHPDFHPSTFLGDSAFDTIETYTFLKDEFNFKKAIIPYNTRNESTLKKVGYNEYGYPLCPNDSSLVMKYCGPCREKGRADRIKWICPKVHMERGQFVCNCDNPCSTAKKGRTTYTYENMSFRMFPGLQRDSDEWNELYKIRTVVERAINHFKMNMCIAGRKSRDHLTTKADVLIAGIASQFTAIIAHRLSCPQYLRSLKPLIA
ncbi:transposase [Sedimentibacter sp. MB31-C6]|uniref:transposase n=1 Tax=Sedimentibacter sp. MB31-C6 TaxID=3109366 RepID=UPI002DDD4F87|nr:transposase [Sedimentibacter sp. MB36-C1]WSI02908.1 transposase [Sedimentibacter sp. MB36-C1]WSI03113.1 transposase [Sedimentibacter sp. MB36-C1]WSI03241.1 transposase [Sedimentibacter sp. MB36-C1]WSI03486.1 transposase [Sedimentibacter sp. MB36-C1]WSI03494.1 transposase [Sedimentibacter sp. MB36-C1]